MSNQNTQDTDLAASGISSSSTSTNAEAKVRFDFASRVHVYTHDYIRFADTKASAILAASGFLFTGLLTRADVIGQLLRKSHSLQFWIIVTGGCGLAGLIFTVWNCIRCIMPRLGSQGHGFIYWDQVEKEKDYVDWMGNLSSEAAISELARHIQAVSRTARQKYECVRYALCGLVVTLVASLFLSILLMAIAFYYG